MSEKMQNNFEYIIDYLKEEFKPSNKYGEYFYIVKNNIFVKMEKNRLTVGFGDRYGYIRPIYYYDVRINKFCIDGSSESVTLSDPLDQFEFLRNHPETSQDAIIFLHDIEYLLRKKNFDLKFNGEIELFRRWS